MKFKRYQKYNFFSFGVRLFFFFFDFFVFDFFDHWGKDDGKLELKITVDDDNYTQYRKIWL